jgi:alpha-glucosidase
VAESELVWWQRGVVYQIYPRSFQDSNGDGIGDLRGVIQRLDYLGQALGVDAIWLSPFYPSPMADFGYDVSNYCDVHPIFGDLATFDELVEEAHRRDLKIMIDFVPNHTSDRHPWFLESRSSRTNPKRDWYVWADGRVGPFRGPVPAGCRSSGGPQSMAAHSSPPNNWLSMFGGSAWEWDEATGQYYLHTYLKEQPDLNWRNPEVREAMLNVMRFWLDRGVDGFRIDAILHIMKDPALRDNPPNPGGRIVLGNPPLPEYDSQLHVHDQAHPDIHRVFREMRQVLDEYSRKQPRMGIGEMDVFDWRVWARYYGAHLDELHMPFNFGLLRVPWAAEAVRGVVDSLEAAIPPGAWPNYVLSNHDVPRTASRVGPAQVRVATMLLLTLRGTPTVYYGEEIGMTDVPIAPEQIQDPLERQLPALGRDPERTPMQWDTSPNAGFCPPGVEPWLPIAADFQRMNVAVESEDSHSMLSLTQALLGLRRSTPALSRGSYQPLGTASPDRFVFLREHDGVRCLVALNFSDSGQTVAAPQLGSGSIVLSTHLDRRGEVRVALLELRPNEGCIVRLAERG